MTARSKNEYSPVNGRSFKIVKRDGKAPFKVILVAADGSEKVFSHHKSQDLALDKCRAFNPGIPVRLGVVQ
jgi:hypothetical protein